MTFITSDKASLCRRRFYGNAEVAAKTPTMLLTGNG
jgi:hypothetical protein